MIIPINFNVSVKPARLVNGNLIQLPDNVELSGWFYGTIIKIGHRVKNKALRSMRRVFCRRTGMIEYKGEVMFNENDILMVCRGNIWYPLGRTLLVARNVEEQVLPSGIIIPACYRTADQSLEATVVQKGLIDDEVFNYPVQIGDKVKIIKWDMFEEINIDGTNCVILQPKHLDYIQHEN